MFQSPKEPDSAASAIHARSHGLRDGDGMRGRDVSGHDVAGHDVPGHDVPGHEFPSAIYMTIIGAFAWMLAVAWLAFASADGTALDLGMVTVLTVVFFAIPLAMHHTSMRDATDAPLSARQFLRSSVDTYTGRMPARQAWMEVALIPVALAVAATAFGIIYWLVG